jgi:hypothetical protein
MLSPIWQRHLCTDPKPHEPKALIVDGVTADALSKLLALSYGTAKTTHAGLAEILDQARVDLLRAAARFELAAARAALEDAARRRLLLENCSGALAQQPSPAVGASRLVDACRLLALGRFDSDDFPAAPASLELEDALEEGALDEEEELEEDLLKFLLKLFLLPARTRCSPAARRPPSTPPPAGWRPAAPAAPHAARASRRAPPSWAPPS